MEEKSTVQQIGNWFRESMTIKLAMIVFLVLLLLIPSAWIQRVIDDRQQYANEATADITTRWAGQQTLAGPLLILPYSKPIFQGTNGSPDKPVYSEVKSQLILLPEDLKMETSMDPQALKRGIFDVNVYNSKVYMKGYFKLPDLSEYGLDTSMIDWKGVKLISSMSDLRGISQDPKWIIGDAEVETSSFSGLPGLGKSYDDFYNGISAVVPDFDHNNNLNFDLKLELKGSNAMYFVPVGKNTSVVATGTWPNPKFTGYFLPDERKVEESGFSATWNVLSYTRPLPDAWDGSIPGYEDTSFGVELLSGVNDYQKTNRTSKYGLLIIIFTFVSLFLAEVITKSKIHPFQYTLIGISLVVYYILLLSFSEQTGFDPAYIIASLATAAMITVYSFSFLMKKVSWLLGALLLIFYTYIFIIISQQDYALLMGGLGLFLVIAVLMYVTRKVNWYRS